MGQVNFWYDLRHDKIWEIQSTWMSLGQGLLSFCCFLRFSDGLMVCQRLPCFWRLLLGFVECLGEPEVSKSKSIARGWTSCWADQAFALRRRNSMDLKRERCEKMWEVDTFEIFFKAFLRSNPCHHVSKFHPRGHGEWHYRSHGTMCKWWLW